MTKTDWDLRFISLANYISEWSKDNTKVGAVIIDKDRLVLSTGFNGFPKGVRDNVPDRHLKPIKFLYAEHAERNAIFAAAKSGISVDGATIFVNWFPCADCARAIIQSGIKRLVCGTPDFNNERWGESFRVAREMLHEAHIDIDYK